MEETSALSQARAYAAEFDARLASLKTALSAPSPDSERPLRWRALRRALESTRELFSDWTPRRAEIDPQDPALWRRANELEARGLKAESALAALEQAQRSLDERRGSVLAEFDRLHRGWKLLQDRLAGEPSGAAGSPNMPQLFARWFELVSGVSRALEEERAVRREAAEAERSWRWLMDEALPVIERRLRDADDTLSLPTLRRLLEEQDLRWAAARQRWAGEGTASAGHEVERQLAAMDRLTRELLAARAEATEARARLVPLEKELLLSRERATADTAASEEAIATWKALCAAAQKDLDGMMAQMLEEAKRAEAADARAEAVEAEAAPLQARAAAAGVEADRQKALAARAAEREAQAQARAEQAGERARLAEVRASTAEDRAAELQDRAAALEDRAAAADAAAEKEKASARELRERARLAESRASAAEARAAAAEARVPEPTSLPPEMGAFPQEPEIPSIEPVLEPGWQTVLQRLRRPLAAAAAQLRRLNAARMPPDFKSAVHLAAGAVAQASDTLRVMEEYLDESAGSQEPHGRADVALDAALTTWQPVLARRGVRVTREVGRGLPAVGVATESLRLAFYQLLRNAFEAMPRGGTLTVTAALDQASGELRITISDSGSGFPESGREGAFQPFQSHKPGHLGLGLALAQRIARRAGGDLEASGGTGGGAVVTMRLPPAQGPTIAEPP